MASQLNSAIMANTDSAHQGSIGKGGRVVEQPTLFQKFKMSRGTLARAFLVSATFIGSMYYINGLATKVKYEAIDSNCSSTTALKNVLSDNTYEDRQRRLNKEMKDDGMNAFGAIAPSYDLRIKEPSDIRKKRAELISRARGQVIELGAGTGRNSHLYDPNVVTSLVMTDSSPAMLNHGLVKTLRGTVENNTLSTSYIFQNGDASVYLPYSTPLERKVRNAISKELSSGQVEVKNSGFTLGPENKPFNLLLKQFPFLATSTSDTTAPLLDPSKPTHVMLANTHLAKYSNTAVEQTLNPTDLVRSSRLPQAFIPANSQDLSSIPDNSFDTVVDTYGLCAYKDPHAALVEMRRICKPEGRVLLLEHGDTPFYFFDLWKEIARKTHLKKWGCDHLKPIDSIVEQSGLKIDYSERFGTMGSEYYFEASPNKTRKGTLIRTPAQKEYESLRSVTVETNAKNKIGRITASVEKS